MRARRGGREVEAADMELWVRVGETEFWEVGGAVREIGVSGRSFILGEEVGLEVARRGGWEVVEDKSRSTVSLSSRKGGGL